MQLSQNIIFTNFFDENQVSSITSRRSEKAGKPVKRLKLGKQAGAGLIVQLVHKNPQQQNWGDTNCSCLQGDIEFPSFVFGSREQTAMFQGKTKLF